MPPVEMVRVNSNAISAVGYDPQAMQLHIRFIQGHTYTYCRVPPSIHQGLMSSWSKGQFFNQQIDGRYHC